MKIQVSPEDSAIENQCHRESIDQRGLFLILVKASFNPLRKLLINLFSKATLLKTWEPKSLGLKPRWTLSLTEMDQKRIKEQHKWRTPAGEGCDAVYAVLGCSSALAAKSPWVLGLLETDARDSVVRSF